MMSRVPHQLCRRIGARAAEALRAAAGCVLCALLLCGGPARGGDIARAAAEGSLWSSSSEELAQGVLAGMKCHVVDATTLRIARTGDHPFAHLMTGDVLLQFSDDRSHVLELRTTIYNKGDNGELTKEEFDALLKTGVECLNELMQVAPTVRKTSAKETGLRLRAWEWQGAACVARLEASTTGVGKKFASEFIRLSMAPSREALARGGADDAARRAELKRNVCCHENGCVWIDGVPMVDQGEKGYCVPASLSRVFAYYGMDGVDQHALAALCKSTGGGTTLEAMEKALRSISAKFHMSVVPLEWLSTKTMEKELMRLLHKQGLPPEALQPQHLLSVVSAKPALLRKGFKSIKKQIDAGIPVVWAVMLGVFPEPEVPQAMGGHMRLIIGYNEREQAIIYSDTWGAGHEMKIMPLNRACAITQALYILRPRR